MVKKLFILTFLAAMTLLISTGCGRKQAAAIPEEPAVPVQIAAATVEDLQEIFTTVGTVEADSKAIISSKVSGRIAQVLVNLGNYVKKGQVLASLEKTDFLNEREQAKATLLQAEASHVENKATFSRMQKLFNEELISRQEYDSAKTQLEIAETSVQQARFGLALREEQLQNTEIRSPITGYVGSRQINPGEMVSPGVKLMEVVDLSNVYITVHLSDSYIAQIKPGQNAQISLTSLQEAIYTGSVDQVSPLADATQKTFPVRIRLDNSSGVFKDGMLAEVKLNFNHRQGVITIPINAVVDEVGTKAVFVVEEDRAIRKIVELGISDGNRIEILSGLTAGEQVVVLGQANLEDGSKVVVK